MKTAFIQAIYNADSVSHLIDLIMLAAVNLSRDDMRAVLIAYKSRLYQLRGELQTITAGARYDRSARTITAG